MELPINKFFMFRILYIHLNLFKLLTKKMKI